MPFGAISTLYLPTAGNAGSSQWGTDVRKLLDAADAGSDSTTKTNHGTGGSVVRTADPYTTTAADLDQSLYGWAITPADMNSVAGAKRRYAAGNHVATIRVGHTAATAKNVNIAMYVYRVGNAAGGRVRTLLGSGTSGTVTIPGTAGELTVNITAALGAILFEPDETIQYVFELGAAGTAVSGDILTVFTGTQSSVVGQIATPTLETVLAGAGTFAGAYDFAGSGFDGAAGPGEGQFAGAYDFAGSNFVGVAGAPSAYGFFNGHYAFDGSGFAGSAPAPPPPFTPGGSNRFTARRTPANRRRSR